jgi:hypothetical protein
MVSWRDSREITLGLSYFIFELCIRNIGSVHIYKFGQAYFRIDCYASGVPHYLPLCTGRSAGQTGYFKKTKKAPARYGLYSDFCFGYSGLYIPINVVQYHNANYRAHGSPDDSTDIQTYKK